MNIEELQFIAGALTEVLNTDKAIRQGGEEKLKQVKSQSPDKYACYLVQALSQGNFPFYSPLVLPFLC